jgi:hypothetical protein
MLKKQLLHFLKKFYKIILIILFFFSLIVFIIIYPFLFNKPEQTIINEYNSETSFFSSDGESSIENGFQGFLNNYERHEFVLTSFDIYEPSYSLVREYSDTLKDITLIKLRRNGFFSWDVVYSQTSNIKNYTFPQVLDLAKTHDLSKQNPDPENITVFKPPTPEEIQRRRESQDFEESQAGQDYVTELKVCYDTFLETEETEEDLNQQIECIITVEEKYKIK